VDLRKIGQPATACVLKIENLSEKEIIFVKTHDPHDSDPDSSLGLRS
jgi:hypothetical protein